MNDVKPDIRALFCDALDRKTPDELAEFLDAACGGDADLRAQVEELLASHRDAGRFLGGTSARGEVTLDLPPQEQPGTQIGPYKLLEQIGEGGMGIVYAASQREPLRRKVALKIIKPGMDTREVVARFEAERQALAMMDHPNIAKVFDAGATEAGRPYFAMELVKGTPITEYCDREQFSMRERLALFVTLCHGVQHAHQKGVIHRDLKPSNLLVEVHDVRPVPKIIDFGIAKAMGQQLSEQSLYTALDQMVGTPLYMSPEQAGQSAVDVDTRSDIYSLGVVLYELLTGHTPFEKDTLRTAGFDEMRRMIREVEPPRPSARVSTLQAADLSTISERRHIEPGKLSQELRGELDWIVMKAMDKDRNRRYATVNDLAADVERYLHDEPVQACPPSVAYRFTKFARRNQAVLVTSALVALALITGTGVSIWQAIRATSAEQAAITERDEKVQQTLRATRAERQTAKALLTAQERLQFGRQAVDDMYTQVAEKWLAQQAELSQVQRQFLEKALAFYQQLATEQSDDPTVRFETAKAQQRAGVIQRKFGQHKEAEAAFRQARELLQQSVREKPDEPQYRDWLAQTRGQLGELLSFMGRLPEAEQELRSALETCQALAAQFPGEAQYQESLASGHRVQAVFLNNAGRPGEAEAGFRQSITLFESLLANFPDDPARRLKLANAQDDLARTIAADKPGEAEALFRTAVDAKIALLKTDPKNIDYREALAASHNNLGLLLRHQLARPLEAETSLRQALPIYQELVAELPEVLNYRKSLSNVLQNLASIVQQAGKDDETEQLARQSWEILNKLATDYPEVPEYQGHAFQLSVELASSLEARGKLEEARAVLEATIARHQDALKNKPDKPEFLSRLARALDRLGSVLDGMGRLDEAEQTRRRAVEIQNGLAANLPNDVGVRTVAGGYLNNLAESLIATGQLPEARQLLEQAVVHQRAALNIDPANAQSQEFLGNHFLLLTEVHVLSGDEDAAAKAAQDVTQFCLTDCDDLIVTATQYIELFIDRAAQCLHDARRSLQQQKFGAKARFLLAKALIREAVQRTPDDPNLWMIANVLTTAPEPLRDPDLALRLARRAVELEPGSEVGTDSLGWALFRAGDYRASLDTIGRQSEAGTCSFVRVMDLWQLGEQTEAGDHFAKANQWLGGYERECEETSKQRILKYPLPAQLKRLQAEAAAMLGVPLPTVEPAPEPAGKVEEVQELPKSTPAPEAAKEGETPQ